VGITVGTRNDLPANFWSLNSEPIYEFILLLSKGSLRALELISIKILGCKYSMFSVSDLYFNSIDRGSVSDLSNPRMSISKSSTPFSINLFFNFS